MKVIVIKNSDSFLAGLDLILKQFLNGIKDAGAEYEVVNLNLLDIKACKACTEDLTFDEKGKCNCDDDMQLIYPKLKDADNWVIATPFTGKIPGKLINFLDRLGPLFNLDPNQIDEDITGSVALISTTAHYDRDGFDLLDEHFQDFCSIISKKYFGSFLRTHSPALDYANTDSNILKEVFSSAENLGRQFVTGNSFDTRDLEIVSRALITKIDYMELNERLYLGN